MQSLYGLKHIVSTCVSARHRAQIDVSQKAGRTPRSRAHNWCILRNPYSDKTVWRCLFGRGTQKLCKVSCKSWRSGKGMEPYLLGARPVFVPSNSSSGEKRRATTRAHRGVYVENNMCRVTQSSAISFSIIDCELMPSYGVGLGAMAM
jgi:hypothetical protein